MAAPFGSYPFDAAGIDLFAHPLFINWNRAPTTNDIYNAGTRIQDNSVNPPIIYQTVGMGIWGQTVSGSATFIGAFTVTGTTNINASGSAVTTIGTGGTGAVNIGNATGGTALTGPLSVTGNITTSAGNVVINGAGKQLQVHGGAVTDFIGQAVLVAGTVTVANTNIATADKIIPARRGINASTALGVFSYSISNGASFTITSLKPADGTTETGDLSTVDYVIVRQV